ncbi:uncharacterized protein K02A2.6-like [Scaptodrosophila lebanonensis]|uniref:RNA-directed DNA polymerase n=1 Tax=Drosophila lebanonensis TaxID=7225 RepID=A0A6J2T234_DROLE|nr:uncharacterized protein K02A2.6-like [Scaptodrosophila lebanonensis]
MPNEVNENSNLQQLLLQQQQFAKTMLEQQQQWMQEILKTNASVSSRSAGDSTICPPFHNFNRDQQNWESYLQQLSQHFQAYSVNDVEKQKAYFLSWIGADVFELLKNLFGSEDLLTYTYTQLIGKLTEHFQFKRHVVAARYEFFKREMKPSQTHKEWVADLRGIARQCKFVCLAPGCSANFVDEMIRDQIIVHTPFDPIRSAALQKLQPTLEDVLIIAESYETTTKTVATLKNESEKHIPVNAVHTRTYANKKKTVRTGNTQNALQSCSGCGHSHARENCKFRHAQCNHCGRKGHIAVVCKSKQQNKNDHKIRRDDQSKTVNDAQRFRQPEIIHSVTGATVSVINLQTYQQINSPKLQKSNKILHAFGKQPIPILGELHTVARCGNKEDKITLIVANVESANNLFGLDLFQTFGFEIQQVANLVEQYAPQISVLCTKYKEVFEPALGVIKNFKATVTLKQNATPKFFKSRQIPFAQLADFKAESERLTNAGIWKPIKFSNWASPIVLAPKPDGTIRICGDFKLAVNAQIDIEQYPLPTRESLLHTVRRGTHFSKIDLKDAYLQMELDDSSKQFMVVSTPLGLFQYQRLPYGIASAPAIFQRYLEQLLNGIEGCGNYLDDIIITAPTVKEHISRVEQVLKVLQDNGVRCKKQKCFFLKHEIEYLGRRISAQGILPDLSGLRAVKELKPSTNLKQLEAFMGKVNYYCNFIPNFSELSAPLNQLRRKNVEFTWGPKQQNAFDALKSHIINATQLAHFHEELPVILATDASEHGIGAVLSNIQPDGMERPIAFASKTLDQHQVNYSQIDKEGLAIIFGVKYFHQYLYGRKFILITDHKPLVNIFSPSKHLPTIASRRLQRWAITLMAYSFDIKYRATSAHGNADALSRLPVGNDEQFDREEACYNITDITPPINADVIRKHCENDPTIKKVRNYVINGWPEKFSKKDDDLKPYFNKKISLVLLQDNLYLQSEANRIIIPSSLRPVILKLLHDGHWGIIRMKQASRQHVWWPGLDDDISKLASTCDICKRNNSSPVKQYQSWPKATTPWERIHIDFAGPIFNSMWLICVDAYSQFPFVTELSSTTSQSTIAALTDIFAIEGYPKTLVSDNGPQLTSETFKDFCNKHGITHITTAPFHPASNGLAERFVQTFKTSVAKKSPRGTYN